MDTVPFDPALAPVPFPRAEVLDLRRFVCPVCRLLCRCERTRATETDQTYVYVCRQTCASAYVVTVRAEPLGDAT